MRKHVVIAAFALAVGVACGQSPISKSPCMGFNQVYTNQTSNQGNLCVDGYINLDGTTSGGYENSVLSDAPAYLKFLNVRYRTADVSPDAQTLFGARGHPPSGKVWVYGEFDGSLITAKRIVLPNGKPARSQQASRFLF